MPEKKPRRKKSTPDRPATCVQVREIPKCGRCGSQVCIGDCTADEAEQARDEAAREAPANGSAQPTAKVAPPANAEVVPARPPGEPQYLVHADGRQYEFAPQAAVEGATACVLVTLAGRRKWDRYVLPREEALELWRRLRAAGFEKW